jgi:hypothetical protein
VLQRGVLLRSWRACVLSGAVWLAPGVASAQEVTAQEVTAQQAAAQGANVEFATNPEKKEATEYYRIGMEAYEKKEFGEALSQFERSFAVVASPNSQLMMARALVQLQRYSEAYATLQNSLDLANALARSNKKYESTAEAANKELADLKTKVGLLTVSVPVSVSVNGQPLQPAEWGKPVAVTPGVTQIKVQAEDRTSESKVELEAGKSDAINLALPQPVQESAAAPQAVVAPTTRNERQHTLGLVSMGVGGVALAVSTVMLVVNQGKIADLRDSCGTRNCPLSVRDDAKSIRTGETVALVGLGVGIVGVAAGVYLVLSSDRAAPAGSSASGRTTLRLGAGDVQFATQF